jgi:hypothetical protein
MQAVLDQSPHDRLVSVERIATAGVVGITGFVPLEEVVDVVRETAVAKRRAGPAAFGCVIEHDVQDDFEARAVQCLHHVAEFVERGQRIVP